MARIKERISVNPNGATIPETQLGENPLDRLGKNQLDVLWHYAQAKTTKEIGKVVFRTENTLHSYRQNICTLLNVHNIESAVFVFLNNNTDSNFVNPFTEMVAEEEIRLKDLTDRRRQLFDLLAQGKTNKEIAEKIGMKGNTIKNTINWIACKWKLRSDLEPRVCMVLIGHAMKTNNHGISISKF